MVNIFTIIMAIIAWIICANQINKCNDRESRYDDKGYTALLPKYDGQTGKPIKRRSNRKYKVSFKYWIKYLIAIIIDFIIMFFNPIQDSIHYIGAIIGLVLIIWSFFDLVKIHNQLVSRPIPQLDKRGGDENA